jgi:hypothetical protein
MPLLPLPELLNLPTPRRERKNKKAPKKSFKPRSKSDNLVCVVATPFSAENLFVDGVTVGEKLPEKKFGGKPSLPKDRVRVCIGWVEKAAPQKFA